MKTTADFLDDLRTKLRLPSDGKLALAMGWKRQQLTPWRQKRETFSDETSLRMALVLEIEPDYIMACMAVQRAKSPATRAIWTRIAAKLAPTAAPQGIRLAETGLAGALDPRPVSQHPPKPRGDPVSSIRPGFQDAISPSAPLRRCDDCALNLSETVHAAFACPMFGRPRAIYDVSGKRSSVELRCIIFKPAPGRAP